MTLNSGQNESVIRENGKILLHKSEFALHSDFKFYVNECKIKCVKHQLW